MMCVIFSLHYSRSEGQDLQTWSLFRMACTSFFKHFSQMTQGQLTFSCPVFSSSAWDASFTLSAVSSSVRQVSWGDDNRLPWDTVRFQRPSFLEVHSMRFQRISWQQLICPKFSKLWVPVAGRTVSLLDHRAGFGSPWPEVVRQRT